MTALATTTRPGETADPDLLEKDLQAETARLAKNLRVPGVAVGIEHTGRRTFAYYGVTGLDNPLAVDGQTLFQIGSNTKTFTATAMVRLHEQGKLDLHAPVRTYIPEFRVRDEDVSARVTVLQLLNHSAGWTGDFFWNTGPGDDALARYVARMADLEQLFPLGSRVSYNNAAFSAAGQVIERVTGLNYEEAVRELVIRPLGLDNTVFPPADVFTRRHADGHYVTKDGVETARGWLLPRSASAAGTLLSTPADMLRYARFHLGGGEGILARESLDLMKRLTVKSPNSAIGEGVGISWLLRGLDPVMVGHGGGTNGQLSAFQLIPERDFAIVVLTNANTGGELHGDLLEWAIERWLGIEPRRFALLEADLGDFTGEYRAQNATLRVEVDEGALKITTEPNETGKAWMRQFAGDQVDKQETPPLRVELLEGERFRAKDGPPRHVGGFIREDGDVVGITVGGRLALR